MGDFIIGAFLPIGLIIGSFIVLEIYRSLKCRFGLHEGYVENKRLHCRHCGWVSEQEDKGDE